MSTLGRLADQFRDMLATPWEKVLFAAWLKALHNGDREKAFLVRARNPKLFVLFGNLMAADSGGDVDQSIIEPDYYLPDVRAWAKRMRDRYGEYVWETAKGGERLGWEDALARSQYGPSWRTSMPAYPTRDDYNAAMQWEMGKETKWPPSIMPPWQKYVVKEEVEYTIFCRSKDEALGFVRRADKSRIRVTKRHRYVDSITPVSPGLKKGGVA